MRIRTFTLALIMTVVNYTTVWAEPLTVSPTQFSEQLSANVPVSGRVLAGVAIANSGSSNFSFLLPAQTSEEQFCFRVISQDGTYSSENLYPTIMMESKSFVGADYPSKYLGELAAFNRHELALLATPGSCENTDNSKVLLTARGNAELDSEVIVFVSSGRSDVYLRVPTENERKKTIKCERIEEGSRTAYDTTCSLSIDELNKGTNEISLMRRKSGRTMPTVSFNIVTGD